jgi:hypothetical protein
LLRSDSSVTTRALGICRIFSIASVRTVGALREAGRSSREKLAIHYVALVQISMIRLLLRRVERSHKA